MIPESAERKNPTRHPNALLQNEILLSLAQEEASNITGLAKKLRRPRPSVSRAMHALKEGGFVCNTARRWKLTEVGQGESVTLLDRPLQSPFDVKALVGDVCGVVDSWSEEMKASIDRDADRFKARIYQLTNQLIKESSRDA